MVGQSSTMSCKKHVSQYKKRFCAEFTKVKQCRRGATCGFAHSREELRAPLLSVQEERCEPSAMTTEFFMNRYKTLWCPIGVQHDWVTCPYAHSYQDARRPVCLGYGVKLCPHWNRKQTCADYLQRCPLGLRCPYSHGRKEQLYHPHFFKTAVCREYRRNRCPRSTFCSFFHKGCEQRPAMVDNVNYNEPVPEQNIPEPWASNFLALPMFADDKVIGNLEPPCPQPDDSQVSDLTAPPGFENYCPPLQMLDKGEPAFIPMPPGLQTLNALEPAFIPLPPELMAMCKKRGTSPAQSTASGSDVENVSSEDESFLPNAREVSYITSCAPLYSTELTA